MKIKEFEKKVKEEDAEKIKERIIFAMKKFLQHKQIINESEQKNREAYFKYRAITKEQFERERDRLEIDRVENKAEIRLLRYLVQF